MKFENDNTKEVCNGAVVETHIRQLGEELSFDIVPLYGDPEKYTFQPQKILDHDTSQRVGPNNEAMEFFLEALLDRLKRNHPQIPWATGIKITQKSTYSLAIEIDFKKLHIDS